MLRGALACAAGTVRQTQTRRRMRRLARRSGPARSVLRRGALRGRVGLTRAGGRSGARGELGGQGAPCCSRAGAGAYGRAALRPHSCVRARCSAVREGRQPLGAGHGRAQAAADSHSDGAEGDRGDSDADADWGGPDGWGPPEPPPAAWELSSFSGVRARCGTRLGAAGRRVAGRASGLRRGRVCLGHGGAGAAGRRRSSRLLPSAVVRAGRKAPAGAARLRCGRTPHTAHGTRHTAHGTRVCGRACLELEPPRMRGNFLGMAGSPWSRDANDRQDGARALPGLQPACAAFDARHGAGWCAASECGQASHSRSCRVLRRLWVNCGCPVGDCACHGPACAAVWCDSCQPLSLSICFVLDTAALTEEAQLLLRTFKWVACGANIWQVLLRCARVIVVRLACVSQLRRAAAGSDGQCRPRHGSADTIAQSTPGEH
jgi:hypothetical protein